MNTRHFIRIACGLFVAPIVSCTSAPQQEAHTSTPTGPAVRPTTTAQMGTLYLWGCGTGAPSYHHISLPGRFDHAFATSYSPVDSCAGASGLTYNAPNAPGGSYWCCFSNYCHYSVLKASVPALDSIGFPFGSQAGDLALAQRIVRPGCIPPSNAPDSVACIGGMAQPYGANGVCHQVANRAVYASYVQANGTTTPLQFTMALPGYAYSHFFYGTYGQDYQNFKLWIVAAGGDSSYVGDNGDALEQQWLKKALGKAYSPEVWAAFQKARHALQAWIHGQAVTKAAANLQATDLVKQVNEAASAKMRQELLPILGSEQAYVRLFGAPSSSTIQLFHADDLH